MAGYCICAASCLHFTTVVNGETYTGSFTLITKIAELRRRFPKSPASVKLMDNDFEVVIFQKDTWQAYVKFLGGVMLNRLRDVDGVVIRRASRVEVMAPDDKRVYIQTDGEAVGSLPATVTAIPDALTLLVPPEYLAR